MADQQQQPGAISAAFPAPPPFYKHFTEQNLSRLHELQQQQAQPDPPTATSSPPPKPLDLPPELRFLIPPAPPSSGLYRSFGDSYNASSPSRLAHHTPLPPPAPTNTPHTHRSPPHSQPSQTKASRNSTPRTHLPPPHLQPPPPPPPPPPPQPQDGRSTTPFTCANSPSRCSSTSSS